MTTPQKEPRVSLLVSDLVVAGFAGDIDIDGMGNLTKLDASVLKSAEPDAKAQRFELITAAKAGRHIELGVTAQTFAQTKKPNRRYLRLAEDKLPDRAGTWKGQPYLTDHNTWSMSASKGGIVSSKAADIDGGMALEQKLNAVKSDAVIGILDGTFCKFSVGWWSNGPILCSVHGSDIMKLDGCNCWPGDKVKLEDGRERVVEFVFSDYLGKETSTVVIPAVQDTHIGDVRAALAAELDIGHRLTRTRVAFSDPDITVPKEQQMLKLARLAAAMGLATLGESDEDSALAAWKALGQRATRAETELAEAKTSLAQAEAALKTLTAASVKLQVDQILAAEGYGKGKLQYGRDEDGKRTASPREARLRRIALSDPKNGIEDLRLELAEMPVVVPISQRSAADHAKTPEPTELGEFDPDSNPYLADACAQLGVKLEDAVKFEREIAEGSR